MSSPTRVSNTPKCTTTIKPDSNGWVPPGTCGYHGKMYYPSFGTAIIFSALAATMLFGHLVQAARFPRSGLHRLAVFSCTCLLTGYVARAIGSHRQQNIYLAAISDTTILVSPIC